jgi:formylglycine-generating enzyme required for sulfatase activity
MSIRLPTEAEWEYACRAGAKMRFGFGDSQNDLGEYAWYSSNSRRKTHPVGQKEPNAWGLHDAHGNVLEWCGDWYGSYPPGSQTSPTGPINGSARVLRGGGWNNDADYCRVAYRHHYGPGTRTFDVGFRLALDSE